MLLGYVLALIASVLWGLTYALDQRVLSAISLYKLYILHSLFGLVVATVLWLVQGHSIGEIFSLDQTKLSLRMLLLTLFVGTTAGFAIFGSIQLLGASKASVLEISYPFFVAIFSYVIFSETVTLPVVVGGLFIFVGSGIIVLSS